MEWIPYVLGAIILAFLSLQALVWLGTRRLVGRPAPNLDGLLEPPTGPGKTLFYFYSPHCGPCRTMGPRVDQVAATHPNVVKVDIQAMPELASRFGVTVTPMVLLVDGGRIAHVAVGAQSEKRLERLLSAPSTPPPPPPPDRP